MKSIRENEKKQRYFNKIRRAVLVFLLIGILFFTFSSTPVFGVTRYMGSSTHKLIEDLDIEYEEVANDFMDSDGLYDRATGKIYVKKGRQQTRLLLHEAIHKIRDEAGLIKSLRMEEIIAVKLTYKIGQLASIKVRLRKYQLPAHINNTLKANNIKPRRLTEEEKIYIEEQIQITLDIIKGKLKEKGWGLRSFDGKKALWIIIVV